MLTLDERVAATYAITLFLRRQDSVRPAIGALLDDEDFTSNLPAAPTPIGWARNIVQQCEDDGWQHQPAWLATLLSRLDYRTPAVTDVLGRIGQPPPAWKGRLPADAYETHWLCRVGMPFVARTFLRRNLRNMAMAKGPSILVLRGASKTGKTYTAEFVDHVLRERHAQSYDVPPDRRGPIPRLAPIGVPPNSGASLTPVALARQIVDAIGPSAIPPPRSDATRNKMNDYLARWVLESGHDPSLEWWVVLDGLDDPDLSKETIEFVSSFARHVARKEYTPHLRLILIDYPSELLAGIPADAMITEEVGPVGEVDLEPFFVDMLERDRPPSSAAVAMAVAMTIKDLPDGPERMSRLNQTLRVLTARASA